MNPRWHKAKMKNLSDELFVLVVNDKNWLYNKSRNKVALVPTITLNTLRENGLAFKEALSLKQHQHLMTSVFQPNVPLLPVVDPDSPVDLHLTVKGWFS